MAGVGRKGLKPCAFCDFFLMMGVQFLSYAILTINYRAISAANTPLAMVTDACAVAMSFFIVRKVVRTESYVTLAGMMIGGSLAAAFGIWMTP